MRITRLDWCLICDQTEAKKKTAHQIVDSRYEREALIFKSVESIVKKNFPMFLHAMTISAFPFATWYENISEEINGTSRNRSFAL